MHQAFTLTRGKTSAQNSLRSGQLFAYTQVCCVLLICFSKLILSSHNTIDLIILEI